MPPAVDDVGDLANTGLMVDESAHYRRVDKIEPCAPRYELILQRPHKPAMPFCFQCLRDAGLGLYAQKFPKF